MEIELTQGHRAEIDFSDWWKVAGRKWYVIKDKDAFYAGTMVDGWYVRMHNVIKPPPRGMIVDHIDRNGLNNRWDNLRHATIGQNNINVDMPQGEDGSGYRGVTITAEGRWKARISWHGERVHIGVYDTPQEAARAYDAKARELHGTFAVTNFGDEAHDGSSLEVDRRGQS